MQTGRFLIALLLVSIGASGQTVNALASETKTLETSVLELQKTLTAKRSAAEKEIKPREDGAIARLEALKKNGCDTGIDPKNIAGGPAPEVMPEGMLKDSNFRWDRDGRNETKLRAHKAGLEEIKQSLDQTANALKAYTSLHGYLLKNYEGILDGQEKACKGKN